MPASKTPESGAAAAAAAPSRSVPASEREEVLVARKSVSGKSSMMVETGVLADRVRESVTGTIMSSATAIGGNIAATKSAFTSSAEAPADPKAYENGAAKGATFAAFINFIISPFFLIFAKKFGAHQCDGCTSRFLYNYWKCTVCADFDLCSDCYPKRASLGRPHDNHEFTQHINADALARTAASAALVAIILRVIIKIFLF